MKAKFSLRSGAAAAVLVGFAATGSCAWADATTDLGPATVTLGGFLASETLYRSRNEGADIGSTFSGIPFPATSTAHTSETRFSARQSRLSVLAQANISEDTHVAFYSEFDFMAGPGSANSNESNSYSPRIRNVYGTIDWDAEGIELLAGQNWSLLTLNSKGITPRNEQNPSTIDAQYSVGFNWARQPQIRIVKNFDHQLWIAVSAENPQTTFAGGPGFGTVAGLNVVNTIVGSSEFDKAANTLSINHIPDVIGKVAWEPMIGGAQPLHIEGFGIYRSFYDRVEVTSATNVLGLPVGNNSYNQSGGGFGGSIAWSIFPKVLDLAITGMTGQGIGRYGSGQLPDVTVQPNGLLAPIQETTALLSATWHVTPLFDLYTYEGQEAEKPKFYNVGTTHLGIGNPAVATAGCATELGTCSVNLQAENQANVGFWWRIYQGKFGSFRFGMQYSYTHLNSFTGVTGSHADTDESMLFTSIRYYPF